LKDTSAGSSSDGSIGALDAWWRGSAALLHWAFIANSVAVHVKIQSTASSAIISDALGEIAVGRLDCAWVHGAGNYRRSIWTNVRLIRWAWLLVLINVIVVASSAVVRNACSLWT